MFVHERPPAAAIAQAVPEHPDEIELNGGTLATRDVEQVARYGCRVTVSSDAWDRIRRSRAVVDQIVASGARVYGVTTGVGPLKRVLIASADLATMQEELVRSHAGGLGPLLPAEVVRAMMLTRVNAMAVGGSGAHPDVVAALVALLNARVHPLVRSMGSVGASDLAPMATIGRVLLGEGEAEHAGRRLRGSEALVAAGLTPLRLGPKDGLALISANSLTTGHGALVVRDCARLIEVFDVAAALSLEGYNANLSIVHPAVQAVRPYRGQLASAQHLSFLLHGSKLWQPEAPQDVQDPLSLRCVTQVHGSFRETLETLTATLEVELNSSGDNPLVVLNEGIIVSNANFDVSLLALQFDALRIALAQVAGLADRRIDKSVSTGFSGLPTGLSMVPGLSASGVGMLNIFAAALSAELRAMAYPVSLGAGSVGEGVEDHASMAPLSVRRTQESLALAIKVAAMELIVAARAVDLRGRMQLGSGTQAAYDTVRAIVGPGAQHVREEHIEEVVATITSGMLERAVAGALAPDASWVL